MEGMVERTDPVFEFVLQDASPVLLRATSDASERKVIGNGLVIEFFLEGVKETSDQAADTGSKQILELFEADRQKVRRFGASSDLGIARASIFTDEDLFYLYLWRLTR